MAPPIKPVDEKLIYDLAKIHCTNEEIASMCGISKDTLEERYSAIYTKGRDEGKASLRRQQIRLIEECNSAPLAIWLGKVYLSQKETIHNTHEVLPPMDVPIGFEKQRKANTPITNDP